MDNQEVIETLKANYPDACYEQLREAVDMAIRYQNAKKYKKYFEDLGKNNPEQAKKEATNELIKMGLLNSDGSTKETIVSI